MHLVTCGHFRSRNKIDSQTIGSAIAENPILHAHFVAVCFTELELLPIEVIHRRNRDFLSFCSLDLELELVTFIYELY